MDLRLRLLLLLGLLFALAFGIGTMLLINNVERAIVDELDETVGLASNWMHANAFQLLGLPPDARGEAARALFEQLQCPHLHITIGGEPVAPPASVAEAPVWFSHLVTPDAELLHRGLRIAEVDFDLRVDANDEIAEAWRETRSILSTLFALFSGVGVMVYVFLGRALAPLKRMAEACGAIERGEYEVQQEVIGLRDIDRLSQGFNHMARALAASHAENRALAQRSLAIQEDERRHLAQELHDEMGQSITAIKALAVSLNESLAPRDHELATRAATISSVSGEIYNGVRRMMARLRPISLDELGLVAALRQMVDEWNARHADTFCRFEAPRKTVQLNADQRIGLYRIAQEALTNIARHAHAQSAEVDLRVEGEPPGRAIMLAITDNGVGFDTARVRGGLGLLGMCERCQALGGEIELHSRPGEGVALHVRVPLVAERPAEETMDA